MNGQPPPPPPPVPPLPPPPPPAPAPIPPQQVIVLPNQGMGCFAKGCLTVLILVFLFFAGLFACTWYVFHQLTSNHLISKAPADVHVDPPSEAQLSAAQNSVNQVKGATGREITVAFTAADLNALFAKDPDFRDLENRARIDLNNSVMTITVSAPLDSLPWPGMEGRWFNGTVRLSGSYVPDSPRIDLLSVRAGDYELPGYILARVNSAINRSLRDNMDDWQRDEFGREFWRHVKSLRIEGDKVMVTTQPE